MGMIRQVEELWRECTRIRSVVFKSANPPQTVFDGLLEYRLITDTGPLGDPLRLFKVGHRDANENRPGYLLFSLFHKSLQQCQEHSAGLQISATGTIARQCSE
jgi:hypothetical protein